MNVLLLRLAGPMQSWGTQSRFSVRDTGREPSKSGVVGLLCAALGRPRREDVSDLAALEMGVRVDREGRLARDYHTVGGERRPGSVLGVTRQGKPIPYGVARAGESGVGPVESNRYYLADADFLVALRGDEGLLRLLDEALRRPRWQLCLGRKAFVPGCPVGVGVREEHPDGLRGLLAVFPWQKRHRRDRCPDRLRLVLETDIDEGEPRPDVPLSFAERRFTVRHVKTVFCPTPRVLEPEEGPPCS